MRASAPALSDLLHEAEHPQMILPLYEVTSEKKAEQVEQFISAKTLAGLPSRYLKSIEDAVALFKFLENKGGSFSACFTPLLGALDEAAKGMILSLLEPDLPSTPEEQRGFFEPSYRGIPDRDQVWLRSNAVNLRKALVYKNPIMPLGLLSFCLEYAQAYLISPVTGIFEVISRQFVRYNNSQLAIRVNEIRGFRNTYIAHQEKELLDIEQTREELRNWISGLAAIYKAHNE